MGSRAEIRDLLSSHNDSASIIIVDPTLASLDVESRAKVCGLYPFCVASSVDEIKDDLQCLKRDRNLIVTFLEKTEEIEKLIEAMPKNNSDIYVILIKQRDDGSVILADLLSQ